MPRESVEHKSLRESLTAARFGAVFVDSDEVSTVFATALSSPAPPARALSGGPSDWAYALFAPTASPRAQGGVPAYVAREIDFVLDALVSLKVLDARALYFDALDATLSDPVRPQSGSAVRVARILHPQCAPVIFVAPARVEAYSRYSIPGGWHADTHEGVGIFEAAMRHCRRCRDRGPAEFDERLVNVAALSAWGGFAMGCGHANRGVFVAHETYDRFEYTIQYMVTLLRLAASLYGNQPALNRAMGWAPQALFSPCDQCYDKIQAEVVELKLVMHVNDIEETLALLIVLGNRLTPARRLHNLDNGVDRDIPFLWRLGEFLEDKVHEVPGENFLRGLTQSERWRSLSDRKTTPFQTAAGDMASTFLRGPSAVASIDDTDTGDHWLAAMVVTNPEGAMSALTHATRSDGSINADALSLRLCEMLQFSGPAFGEMWPAAAPAIVVPDRPFRAKMCRGTGGELCLFNEHSGIVPPCSVKHFFDGLGIGKQERAAVALGNLQLFARLIDTAYVCAFVRLDLKLDATKCCFCNPMRRLTGDSRRLVFIAWTDVDVPHVQPVAAAFAPAATSAPAAPVQEPELERIVDVYGHTDADDDPPAVDIELDGPLVDLPDHDVDASLYESLQADEDDNVDDIGVNPQHVPMQSDTDNVPIPSMIRANPLPPPPPPPPPPVIKTAPSPIHIHSDPAAPVRTFRPVSTLPTNTLRTDHAPLIDPANWAPFSLLANTCAAEPNPLLGEGLHSLSNPRRAPSATASESDTAVAGDSDDDHYGHYMGGITVPGVDSPVIPPNAWAGATATPQPAAASIGYYVLDAEDWAHVIASGNDDAVDKHPATRCVVCGGRFVFIPVPDAGGALEVQLNQTIEVDMARKRLVAGIVAAHDIFRA